MNIPACWSWPVPVLPQPNHRGPLDAWQAGRCAVCGSTPLVLVEDHDHVTGGTRGYLCLSCNAAEGVTSAQQFQRYRARPPAAILGLTIRYGLVVHPLDRRAWAALENALSDGAGDRTLVDALHRVGLTLREWDATLRRREDAR